MFHRSLKKLFYLLFFSLRHTLILKNVEHRNGVALCLYIPIGLPVPIPENETERAERYRSKNP